MFGHEPITFAKARFECLVVNNNFGPPSATPSSVFPRQSGPYTLLVTQGVSVIKGLSLGYDVTYDVTALPEPSTLLLAGLCFVVVATRPGVGRRRVG